METKIPRWLLIAVGVVLLLFLVLVTTQKWYEVKGVIKNQKPANTMSVSADGKVSATPDMATVTLGVMTNGSSAQDVKDQNNKAVNKIVDFIKQKGIDSKDINTSQFYFYPQQDWKNGVSSITGYQGNQTVTIKVRGIDKDQTVLEKILDGVVNNGANQIQGINFSFADPDALRQQARKDAIAKAKEKAQELAQEAGLSLGKVVSVSEAGGYNPMPIPYAMGLGAGGASPLMDSKSVAPNVEPGSQDITATMTVVFEVK